MTVGNLTGFAPFLCLPGKPYDQWEPSGCPDLLFNLFVFLLLILLVESVWKAVDRGSGWLENVWIPTAAQPLSSAMSLDMQEDWLPVILTGSHPREEEMPFSVSDKLEVLGSGCLSDPQEWEDAIGEEDANSASQEVENPALALKDHIVMSAGEERGDDEIPQGSIASCSESKKLDTVGQSLGKRAQTSGELLCLVTWCRVEDLFPEYSGSPIKRVQ